MSTLNTSKSTCKHSCTKCVFPAANNLAINEDGSPIRTNDVNINGNSYVNTPSPSSNASSTIDRSYRYRSNSKSDFHSQMSFKRRHRHDNLFHYTHSLNRRYVITMTNILFQMQKELYKLKRRTHHVEQMFANQRHAVQPIIRIPRLTRDEISAICVNNNNKQQNIASMIFENANNNESLSSPPSPMNNIDSSIEHKDDTESSITLEPQNSIPTTTESSITLEPQNSIPVTIESEASIERNNLQQQQQQQSTTNKYCSACDHEFSHRSAYLRHIRRIHHGVYPTISNNDNLLEIDSSHNETPVLTTDQPDIETESDSIQVLVNQWDIGEGRLRPRRGVKSSSKPLIKIKCDICNKFFRDGYLKKHQRSAHHIPQSPPSNELNDMFDEITPINAKPMDDIQTPADGSSINTTNPPSTITVAEMDTDDIPIRFRKETNKQIVIAVTCLDRDQLDILEEFLAKFSSRVCQTSSIDSRTTHLITNDDQHRLRSPLSMKLIEGIANHCFCVSYRWIIDCIKYDRIIDEIPYEIEGDDTNIHPHDGPKRSRLVEKRHALFENIRFMIKCNESSDIKMTNDRLHDLITTCGGEIINCVTQEYLTQYEIVVLCDKLYVTERRHNYDQCRSLGIHFVSSDWVLESILEYRQKLFSLYEETPL